MPELLERPGTETDVSLFASPAGDIAGFTSQERRPKADEYVPRHLYPEPVIPIQQETVPQPERLSLRERFNRTRLGRTALSLAAAVGLIGGVVAVEAAPAHADSGLEPIV